MIPPYLNGKLQQSSLYSSPTKNEVKKVYSSSILAICNLSDKIGLSNYKPRIAMFHITTHNSGTVNSVMRGLPVLLFLGIIT